MNGVIAASRRRGGAGIPTVPQSLAVEFGTLCQTTFTLTWSPSSNPDGYKIFKNGTLFIDTGNTLNEYNVTGQTAGTTNTWTISAYNGVGESAQSAGLSVTQGVNVNLINSVSPNLSLNFSTSLNACNATLISTRYVTGGPTPGNNETVYTDSCGTQPLNGAGDWYSDGSSAFQISTTGVISNLESCPG